MDDNEIQREVLNKVIKSIIIRIKELQKRLIAEEKDCNELGHYSDCGSFYQEQVIKTKAVISELVSQKISLQKWRKKLKYITAEK